MKTGQRIPRGELSATELNARGTFEVKSHWRALLFLMALVASLSTPPLVEAQEGESWRSEDQWVRQTSRNIGIPERFEDQSVRKVEVGPTGDFGLQIPLLIVPGRNGLDANLSLSYTPGVRVTQEASWVGTGWNLSIGSITRNPVIRMDEDILQRYSDPYPPLYTEEHESNDRYRDTYTITFPGGSGTIIQITDPSDVHKYSFVMEDWRAWKITYDTSVNPYLNRFIVTVEDGTTYVFGFPLNGATTNVWIPQAHMGNNHIPEPIRPDRRQMQWLLTAILSPDYVDGDGDPYDPQDESSSPAENMGSWIKVYYKYDSTNPRKHFLYENITQPSFGVSHSECAYPFWIVTPIFIAILKTEDEGAGSSSSYYGNFVSYQMSGLVKKRLKDIRLFRNEGLGSTGYTFHQPLKTVAFSYYQSGSHFLHDRTFLKEVSISGGDVVIPPFKFEYWHNFDGASDPDPNMSQNPIAEGHIGGDGWYTKDPDELNLISDKVHDSLDGRFWNLSKVTYPSGGTIEFEYQSDKAIYVDNTPLYPALHWGPGTRLKSQKLSDGTAITATYSYEYATLDGGNYLVDAGSRYEPPISYIDFGSDQYFNLWAWRQRPRTIMYGRITETQPSGGGKVASYYSVRDVSSTVSGDNVNVTDIADVYNKVLRKRGLLLKREFLNSAGLIVKEERFGYRETPIVYDRVGGVGGIIQVSTQKLDDTTVTTVFDQFGQNGVTTTTVNENHPADGLPWRNAVTNSDGQRYINVYKRPSYYPDLTSLGTMDLMVLGIAALQREGLLDKIVEHHFLREAGGNTFVLSSDFFGYRTDLGNRLLGCPLPESPGGDSQCEGAGSSHPRLYRRYSLDVDRPTLLSAIDTPCVLPNGTFSCDASYVPLEKTTAVDQWGNVRERVDANGTVTTTKFGTARSSDWTTMVYIPDTLSVPIATIVNSTEHDSRVVLCEVFDGDSLAHGFTKIGTPTCSSVSQGDAGSYQSVNVVVPGDGIAVTMDTLVNASRQYVVEFDYEVVSGRLILTRNTPTGNVTLASYSGEPGWHHARVTCGFTTIHRLLTWESDTVSVFRIDNVRIYPVDALCFTQTYDQNTMKVSSSMDPSGQMKYSMHDSLGRMARATDGEKQTRWTYYYSRSGSSGNYEHTRPNYVATESGAGASPGFNILADPSFETEVVWLSGWGFYSMEFTSDAKEGNQAVWITSGTAYIGQNVGRLRSDQHYEASIWVKAATSNGSGYITLAVGRPQDVALYDSVCLSFDGDEWQSVSGILDNVHDDTTAVFYVVASAGCIYDCAMLIEAGVTQPEVPPPPLISRVYFDGFGAEIQTQTNLADSDIVFASEYDSLRRPSLVTKQYQVLYPPGESHNYDANYIGKSAAYYPQTGGFAYSQTTYLADPLGRISQESSPGAAFKMGTGKEVKYNYFSNASNEISGYSANELFKTRRRDEDNNVVSTFTDKLGNVVATVVDSGGLNLVTRSFFEAPGQLTRSVNPKGDTTSYTYNTIGLVKRTTTVDAGTVEYIYDDAGNPRFTKDAAHAGSLNEVSIYGDDTGGSPQEGEFTLTMPGKVTLAANCYAFEPVEEQGAVEGSEPPSATTASVSIMARNGPVLTSIVASTAESPAASGEIILPKGTYNYSVVLLEGSGAFTYEITCTTGYEFAYHKYDRLNRVAEVGEYEISGSTQFTKANSLNMEFPASSGADRLLSRQFIYDTSANDASAPGQTNLQGRVSAAKSYRLGVLVQTTFYSYDDLGRVEWLVHKTNGTSTKKIMYSYDVFGNLKTKTFVDPTSAYNFTTYYEYDQAGRLTRVLSSTGTDTAKVQEAWYTYLANGQVKRLQLGNAQGVDYEYTERDWVKQINDITLATEPQGLPQDKLGMKLGYNVLQEIGTAQASPSLHNGNISWMAYNMSGVNFTLGQEIPTARVGYSFAYDKASRIRKADFGAFSMLDYIWNEADAFDVKKYTYDKVGNLDSLVRYGSLGTSMDFFKYHYLTGTNRLDRIADTVGATRYASDVDNQTGGNYAYDANGNMQQDLGNGIGFVIYDMHNLPVMVYKTDGSSMQYWYDTQGNRIRKFGTGGTYYYNGADGKAEVVSPVFTTATYNIWGNDNLGQVKRTWSTWNRFYYLKDHLGTIRMTVDGSGAVSSWDDVDPFGMVMEGRSGNVGQSDARYKFTGKERDLETGYDYFGARYYDARIGRWLGVDPLAGTYPSASPYNYVLNNPLSNIDLHGDSVSVITSGPTTENTPGQSNSNSLAGHTAINVDGLVYSFEGGGKWKTYPYSGYMGNETQVRTVTEQTVKVDQGKVEDALDNRLNGDYNPETNSCVSNTMNVLDAGGISFNKPNGAVTPEQLSNSLQNSDYVTNATRNVSFRGSSLSGTMIYRLVESLGIQQLNRILTGANVNTVPLLPAKK